MSSEPLKLAVVLGSVRTGRFGQVVANWFLDQAQQHNQFSVELLDLAQTPLPLSLPPEPPSMMPAEARPVEMAKFSAALAGADAFIVITPEYNHSFPASIKAAIDWHFVEWRAKPVGFVSYGGVGGGLRAVEQLRQVFAEMHAVTVRDSVSFHKFWELFDATGQLTDPEGANIAAKVLLDQLLWWAGALHDARVKSPYSPER